MTKLLLNAVLAHSFAARAVSSNSYVPSCRCGSFLLINPLRNRHSVVSRMRWYIRDFVLADLKRAIFTNQQLSLARKKNEHFLFILGTILAAGLPRLPTIFRRLIDFHCPAINPLGVGQQRCVSCIFDIETQGRFVSSFAPRSGALPL